MKANLYKMTCLTNLHVGNGDVNYSIIDNEVEKDPVLGEPVIPSSGVKGALLSFIKDKYGVDNINIKTVFGNQDRAGDYKFLTAGLLARPVRVSEGSGAYVLATSPEIMSAYIEICKELGINSGVRVSLDEIKNCGSCITGDSNIHKVEGFKVTKSASEEVINNMRELFGANSWAILSHEKLREIELPVSARNSLKDNGESKNLWYEEYVPHHSIFYMIVITQDDVNLLDKELNINGEIVQFGADASIGFGLVKIVKMEALA